MNNSESSCFLNITENWKKVKVKINLFDRGSR